MAITGRSCRLKDQAAAAGKDQKHYNAKSNEPVTAARASQGSQIGSLLVHLGVRSVLKNLDLSRQPGTMTE
jgi:hypothetical protein